jgi:flagellar biogenesis protein FliO
MRTRILLSMMVLATAPAARADATPTESCVLKTPLKATRPGGMSRWETLAPGTALSMVSRKSDWSRVRQGDIVHIVATAQFTQACVAPAPPALTAQPEAAAKPEAPVAAKPEPTSASTTSAPEAVAAKPEPTSASSPPAPEAAPAAKPEAPVAVAKPELATTVVPAVTTTKVEATESKKPKVEPLPSSPSSGQLFVLGLLVLGAVFTGVFLRRRVVVEQSHLDVVATRTLGRGKQLVIVDAGDARLLLGVTEQGITLLSSTASAAPASPSSSPSSSFRSSSRSSLSLLTEEEEAATASPAASFFKGIGAKVGSIWGRPPSGPPAEWDSFDRILASTVPDSSVDAEPPAKSRRSSERSSSASGAADIAELARELQRHGARRSA